MNMRLLYFCFLLNDSCESTAVPVQAVKAHDGEEVELHTFLTSPLYGDGWSTVGPSRLFPGKGTPVPIGKKKAG